MMATFENSLHVLKSLEGGWVNHPNDRGKETFAGISRRWFPDWSGWEIIDQLRESPQFPGVLQLSAPLKIAKANFYREEFWNRHRLDKLENQETADEIFEMAVNIGHRPAAKITQKALNLLNKRGTLYRNIPEDGQIGPLTVSILNSFKDNPRPLVRTLNGLQFEYYKDLAEIDETQEVFFYGWLART